MKNLKVELAAGKKIKGENPQWNLPGRDAVVFTVSNSNNASQLNS